MTRTLRTLLLLGLPALIGAACILALSAGPPRATAATQASQGRLKAHIRLDGAPYPASVTVAADGFKRVFPNVSEIDASVPSDATYTIEAAVPDPSATDGRITFKDVIPRLTIAAGSTFEIDVHLIPESNVRAFDPVLLIEEVGAQAVVQTAVERDPLRPERFTLKTEVRGTPGKRVILDTIAQQIGSTQGFLCLAPCRHLYPASGDGYTCSTTAKVHHGYWIPNYNMCEFTIETSGSSRVESTFEALPPGRGGVVLNAAIRDSAIIRPRAAELKSIRSGETARIAPPFTARGFPDFVVPPGSYTYTLEIPAQAGSSITQRLTLPIEVADRAIRSIFLSVPAPGEISDFRALALGDNRLGLALHGVRSSLDGHTLRIDLDLDDPAASTGWVIVPFPRQLSVGEVRTVPFGATSRGERLTELHDYTVGPLGNRNALTLRAGRGATAYTIQFSPDSGWDAAERRVGRAMPAVPVRPREPSSPLLAAGSSSPTALDAFVTIDGTSQLRLDYPVSQKSSMPRRRAVRGRARGDRSWSATANRSAARRR